MKIATAVVVMSILTAPAVNASPYTQNELEFLRDVDMIGVMSTSGNSDLLNVGWEACIRLDQGFSSESIARSYLNASYHGQGARDSITITQARQLVQLSAIDLCPEHASNGVLA